MEDLPLSPEAWLDIVNTAVTESGHAAEVQVGLETTMDGWRVFVTSLLPVPAPPQVIE